MKEIFNNREVATGIWLIVVIFFGVKHREIRKSCRQTLKSFCHWKIIVTFVIMALYIVLCVLLLGQLTLWNTSMLKDTVYWFLFSSFILCTNLMAGNDYANFFKKTVLSCFKVVVLMQFLINLYTFPLWGELIFIPVITLLAMMNVVAESKPEYEPAKKLFDGILSIIGLGLVIYLIHMTWLHYSELSVSELLLSVLLPILLTFLFFPFLYFAKLIANYEVFFARLQIHISNNDDLLNYTCFKTLQHCHVNLIRLDRFEKFFLSNLWDTFDRDGVKRIITNFKSRQNNER